MGIWGTCSWRVARSRPWGFLHFFGLRLAIYEVFLLWVGSQGVPNFGFSASLTSACEGLGLGGGGAG